MTPAMKEAVEAYRLHGSQQAAAEALGISRSAVRERLKNAAAHQKRFDALPDGVKAAMEASGTDLDTARHGWRVVQHDDGSRDSVFWRNDATDDIVARIKSAFDDLPAAQIVPPPAHKAPDLLTLYPIADAHIGMMAWGRETGEDYDTRIATERLVSWLGRRSRLPRLRRLP